MDVAEFEELLDRLGEDLSHWPAPSRDAARALLRRSAEARDLVVRAEEMRRALAPTSVIRAPAGLADRIVARAMETSPPAYRGKAPVPPVPSVALMAHAFPLRPAVVLSVCFVIGLTVGLLPAGRLGDPARVDFATLLARMAD